MRSDYIPSAPLSADAADALARRVASALVADARADALAAVLAHGVRDAACYEASIRTTAGGAPSAGRMMIERASAAVVDAIATALGVALPPAAAQWLQAAGREGVPIIAGWDRRGGGAERCVKLYVNASDIAHAARAGLLAALAPDLSNTAEPPAVIGMNARADGAIETKLYVQSADALALAERASAPAHRLAAAARADGADAGGVLSFDVAGGALHARAFFVALREPAGESLWPCVRALPGFDAARIEALLPFAPAPPRSIGQSLDGGTWTLYCKPLDSGRAPAALEPAAIFRLDDAEVGVFVEPTEHARRAFSRTERHAVSVRVRAGAPVPQALESLIGWFTETLRAAERAGGDLAARFNDPPTPWRAVDLDARLGRPGAQP
jgi:hypothetical protein